jgi:hypothetical protein
MGGAGNHSPLFSIDSILNAIPSNSDAGIYQPGEERSVDQKPAPLGIVGSAGFGRNCLKNGQADVGEVLVSFIAASRP